jgi:hypothetical protein
MGLAVTVETEDGNRVAEVLDSANILHRLLPSHDDATYHCLRYVDWYGDTVFNRLQMEAVLPELDRIRLGARESGERELVDRVKELAHRCQAEPHLYLKFYGD